MKTKKTHVQPIFSFLQEYNESCFVAENSVQGTVFYGFSFPDLVMELYTPFKYEHLSTCNLNFLRHFQTHLSFLLRACVRPSVLLLQVVTVFHFGRFGSAGEALSFGHAP
jgi:hypothetical protein